MGMGYEQRVCSNAIPSTLELQVASDSERVKWVRLTTTLVLLSRVKRLAPHTQIARFSQIAPHQSDCSPSVRLPPSVRLLPPVRLLPISQIAPHQIGSSVNLTANMSNQHTHTVGSGHAARTACHCPPQSSLAHCGPACPVPSSNWSVLSSAVDHSTINDRDVPVVSAPGYLLHT